MLATLLLALALQSPDPIDTTGCLAIARDPRSTNVVATGCPWPNPIRISYTPFASSIFDGMRDRLPAGMGTSATSSATPEDPAVVPPASGAAESSTSAKQPKPAKQPRRTPSGERCHPAYDGCIVPFRGKGDVLDCPDIGDAQVNLVDKAVDPYRLDDSGVGNGVTCDDIG
jgi:hypothetical protein